MDRQQAWDLVCQYTVSDSLRKHMLAVEAAMRAYARRAGADENEWGIVGLLHDFDYERWPNAPDHPLQGAAILADGLAGGHAADIVQTLGIRDATGTVLDHLYVITPEAARQRLGI